MDCGLRGQDGIEEWRGEWRNRDRRVQEGGLRGQMKIMRGGVGE